MYILLSVLQAVINLYENFTIYKLHENAIVSEKSVSIGFLFEYFVGLLDKSHDSMDDSCRTGVYNGHSSI